MYQLSKVCKITNTTKKAINYYEKVGLLKITRNDKGIRIFNDDDLNLIKCINFYRNLNYSTNQIKTILANKENHEIINELLLLQKQKLENEVDNLQNQINIINNVIKTKKINPPNPATINYIEDIIFMKLTGTPQAFTIYCSKKEYQLLIKLINLLTIGLVGIIISLIIFNIKGVI